MGYRSWDLHEGLVKEQIYLRRYYGCRLVARGWRGDPGWRWSAELRINLSNNENVTLYKRGVSENHRVAKGDARRAGKRILLLAAALLKALEAK